MNLQKTKYTVWLQTVDGRAYVVDILPIVEIANNYDVSVKHIITCIEKGEAFATTEKGKYVAVLKEDYAS